jgi:ABC-type spermidine/putrescine transport system permease subunit II
MEVNNTNIVTTEKLRPNNASVIAGFTALGLVLLVSLILFGNEVILSLKEYNVFKGISGSPWVGLKNYQHLFADVNTERIIINTLVYNLLFAGFCFCIASVGGLAVHAFPKKSIFRDALAVLAVLPVLLHSCSPGSTVGRFFGRILLTFPPKNYGKSGKHQSHLQGLFLYESYVSLETQLLSVIF